MKKIHFGSRTWRYNALVVKFPNDDVSEKEAYTPRLPPRGKE